MAMRALNGPVSRFRAGGAVAEADCCEGVSGCDEVSPLMLPIKLVMPPRRSVASADACTCEPAMSLRTFL